MSTEKSPSLLETVQAKIAELIDDFRNAEISPEQFNTVYSRYYHQLLLALRVAEDDMRDKSSDDGTFKIDDLRKGKAIGIGLYHHNNQEIIATLGHYDLAAKMTLDVLTDISAKLAADTYVEPMRVPYEDRWIVYITEDYTTAIAVYEKEPTEQRMMNLARIMQDFEHANHAILQTKTIDAHQLAQPLLAVVKSSKS